MTQAHTPRTDALMRLNEGKIWTVLACDIEDLCRELETVNAELLSALDVALATIGSLAPDHPPTDYVAKNESIIRAAIAKAKP